MAERKEGNMRDKMTSSEARHFERGPSIANMIRVKQCLACGCEPYVDVFTYQRWLAQGMQVQRGQKSVRIPVMVRGEKTDEATGEKVAYRMRRTSAVFCRCQVAPCSRNDGAAVSTVTTVPAEPQSSSLSDPGEPVSVEVAR